MAQMLALVPFLLARQFLSSEQGLREILLALMVGGLIYSIPSLIEIRLSPQINVWIYGFFQHSFEQTIRAGGYRPIVFLPHGLWLALFMCTALLSAAALARHTRAIDRWKMLLLVAYLAVLLVMSKSLASLAYGIVLVPLSGGAFFFGFGKTMIASLIAHLAYGATLGFLYQRRS